MADMLPNVSECVDICRLDAYTCVQHHTPSREHDPVAARFSCSRPGASVPTGIAAKHRPDFEHNRDRKDNGVVMYAPERQQAILGHARSAGRVDVNGLAELFEVTPETIRR